MKEPQPPELEKVEYGSFIAGPAAFFFLGLLVGIPVEMATAPKFRPHGTYASALWDTMLMCGSIGAAGCFVMVALGAVLIERRNAAAQRRYERELQAFEKHRQAQVDNARTAYASAYASYLPKWQAWHLEYRRYITALGNYTAWERDFTAAFGPFRQRVVAAIEAFKVFHFNIDKRARLELELTSPAHRQALFREAFTEAARQQQDFGFFRLIETDPALAARIPELEKFKSDEGLAVVRGILPPLPSVPPVLREVKQKPTEPTRPDAPQGILFWSNGGKDAAPVPPDKVTFTPN